MRSAVAASVALIAASGPARAREHVTIDYALPAVTVTAGVAQRIASCPASAEAQADAPAGSESSGPRFAYKVAIAAKRSPRRIIALDAESGFLVDRETKVHFGEDWFLKDFNGRTTGQGAPLLISLIKAGAAVATMTANPIVGVGVAAAVKSRGVVDEGRERPRPRPRYFASRWYLECRPAVAARLVELDKLRAQVGELEGLIVAGDNSPATQDLLALRRTQAGDLEAALTVNAVLKGGLTPTLKPDATVGDLVGRIAAPDIAQWFQLTRVRREVRAARFAVDDPKPDLVALLRARDGEIPGIHGYQVRIAPDARIAAWFGCVPSSAQAAACAAAVTATEPLRTRDLTYVRPIPASVKLWPNRTQCPAAAVCEPADDWPEAKSATGSADVRLPQLSRLLTLRTGGSIFGGRTVGAEFGADGEPTMLQYNVGGGAKDVGSVIDAGVAGAQTMRDAPGAATKRRLEELKNARDLQDLLDELEAEGS